MNRRPRVPPTKLDVYSHIYSFMVVEVTGNHLGAIVQTIGSGNCERIHEFHRKLYEVPEPNAPIIESITITSAAGK